MAELYALADLPPPPRRRPPLAVGVAVGLLAAAAVVYPGLAASAIERLGVRGVAVALLVVGLVSFGASWRVRRALGLHAGPVPAIGLALLAGTAALTGEGLPLLLVPAWAYAVVAMIFWRSLDDGASLVETGARFLHPYAPTFIRSYCRKVTLAWAALFAGCALVTLGLAVWAPSAWWRAFTIFYVFVPMVGLLVVEFAVRKWWFRYYPFGGPIDRIFSWLFPSHGTAVGRRSHEYILEMRHRLAAERDGRETAS